MHVHVRSPLFRGLERMPLVLLSVQDGTGLVKRAPRLVSEPMFSFGRFRDEWSPSVS